MPKDKSKPRPGSDIVSSLSELGARILHYLQAGYPGLYLVSPEEQRVEAELKVVTDHLNRDRVAKEHYQLCYWSVVDGLVNTETKQVHSANDPLDVLQVITEQQERMIVLLKDYHLFLQDPNPILVRKLKDVLLEAKTKQKTLFIVGCRLVLPPELEREITVWSSSPYPGRKPSVTSSTESWNRPSSKTSQSSSRKKPSKLRVA